MDRNVYTHIGISAIQKEILPFGTTLMDLEDIILGEISLTQKDKYHLIGLV